VQFADVEAIPQRSQARLDVNLSAAVATSVVFSNGNAP